MVSSPAYFLIAPSVSLQGQGRGAGKRRVTCFKLCAGTGVVSRALNFKQNAWGGGGWGVAWGGEGGALRGGGGGGV